MNLKFYCILPKFAEAEVHKMKHTQRCALLLVACVHFWAPGGIWYILLFASLPRALLAGIHGIL